LDETRAFQTELEDVHRSVEKLKELSNRRGAEEQVRNIASIQARLQKLNKDREFINAQEADLDFEITDFPALPKIMKNVKPYEELWKLALDVYSTIDPYLTDAWTRMPIEELDPDEIEDKFKVMRRTCNRSKTAMEQLKVKAPKNMASQIAGVLDNFSQWIPIIRALNIQGLKKKHLDRINQKINEGKDIEMNLELSMDIQALGSMDIKKFTADIEEISDIAGKEYQNE